jgi:hypothetical protein
MFDDHYWSYPACGNNSCDTFSFRYKLKDSLLTYNITATWDIENIIKKLTKDSLIFYSKEHKKIFKYSR